MKSRIAVSVLSLSVAVLSLVLGGCNGNINNESESLSGVSQSAENSGSSAITDSSDNSGNSGSSSAPESAPEPQKPAGEPTFLTAPDGTPIYTSEISEIYEGSWEIEDKKTITFEQAEQMAQTGDDLFTIKCDGFIYGCIPERALNRIDNPDMFVEDEYGSFDYLGEVSDKASNGNMRLTDFTRIKPGDKFGELTVKNAYILFAGNPKYDDRTYVPGAHISGGCIEFDGALELEGYICVTPTDTLYGEGGDMRFYPDGDSSTKLPSTPFWNKDDQKYYAFSHADSEGYIGGWDLKLGNMYKVDCDTSGLQPGDSMVKAKISLENIGCIAGFGGWKVDLKSIELL